MVTKSLLLLSIGFIFALFISTVAQNSCDAYRDILEDQVYRMFTSERSSNYRTAAFPQDLQNVSESEISRLNLPGEQDICDQLLSKLNTESASGEPDKERAMWKIKSYYLLVVYSYYTDSQGNQLTQGTVAGLFDSDFQLVQLIPRI